MYQTYF
jgi:hypothetical protein